jgi:ketosteroid isomerase-like protein
VTIELVALEPLPAVGRGDADRDAAKIEATLIAVRGCDQSETGQSDQTGQTAQTAQPTVQPVLDAAPSGAAAAVVAFHAALAAGDGDRALALLAPETVVFEAGGAELSRAEYAAHHLAADMEFAAAVAREVIDVRVDELGDVAWVASRTRARGTFRARAIDASGVETMVLSRRAGEWRIVHIHWSSRAAR